MKVSSDASEWRGQDPNADDGGWVVYGWSRGYVAFDKTRTDDGKFATTATALSSDGINWTPGGSWTQAVSEDDGGVNTDILGVVEGPAGLLAYNGYASACTAIAWHVFPSAVSPDGRTWTPVTQSLGDVQTIEGGGAGYLALGTDGVSISSDGLRWKKASLTDKAFARLSAVEGGVVADAGFVIFGVTYGAEDEGCGAGPALLDPTLWFSGDGSAWTTLALPHAIAAREPILNICRVGPVLVADERLGSKMMTWTSRDGRTWALLAGNFACEDTQHNPDFLHGAGRIVFVGQASNGSATFSLLNDDLSQTDLPQTGDPPDPDGVGTFVLGPAGIVGSDGQGYVYVGVPLTN